MRRTAAIGLLFGLLVGTASANDGFARLEGHGGPIKGVAISPDGTRALTASFDYTVGFWNLTTGQLIRRLEGHEAAVNTVAFLGTDGSWALSAGDDFSMNLWSLYDGELIWSFEGHKGKILSIRTGFPKWYNALTASWDGWVGIWDTKGANHLRWLKGHKAGVNDVLVSGDGTTVYTASSDGTIRTWEWATGEQMRTVIKHGFGVNHLVLNEDAGWLAYGAVDGAVRAIDLTTDEKLADLTADRRPILALALSPDGTRLAVGDGEGYVMIIDTGTWTIERDFHAAARGPIWALAWTPDGKRVLSGGLDDAAALWPIAAAAEDVEGLLTRGERSFLKDPSEMTNGERQFARKCSICHTLTPDGANRAGPTLYGLFGRNAGTVPGYRYSRALSTAKIVWEAETINRLFDEGPDHYTPGSKMPMQRISKAKDRDDLIAFLAANTGPRADGETAAPKGEDNQ